MANEESNDFFFCLKTGNFSHYQILNLTATGFLGLGMFFHRSMLKLFRI